MLGPVTFEDRRMLLRRLSVVRIGVVACLGLLAVGFWMLQVPQFEKYAEMAQNNQLRTIPRRAPRGVLFDRNGRVLVYDQGQTQAAPDGGGRGALLTRLELAPGRYELRAAVEDPNTSESGSVYTYVDVPDYAAQAVTLSGILLSTNPAQTIGLLNNPLRPPLPSAPTLRREFGSTEHITAWVQIYQGLVRQAMPGYVLIEVRDENDTRVFHQETRTLASDVGANRATTIDFELPLSNLERGQHLLRVDVRQGNATATRELRFAVK